MFVSEVVMVTQGRTQPEFVRSNANDRITRIEAKTRAEWSGRSGIYTTEYVQIKSDERLLFLSFFLLSRVDDVQVV